MASHPNPHPQHSPASGAGAPASGTGEAPDAASIAVPNDRAAIDAVQNQLVAAIERHHFPKAAVFAIRLAVHEAMANAFGHGHKNLPPTVPVFVKYAVDDRAVDISIEDQGPGFEPEAVPDPTLDENLETPSGRGLMLMRAYMTTVRYANRGKRLEMVYKRPAENA